MNKTFDVAFEVISWIFSVVLMMCMIGVAIVILYFMGMVVSIIWNGEI